MTDAEITPPTDAELHRMWLDATNRSDAPGYFDRERGALRAVFDAGVAFEAGRASVTEPKPTDAEVARLQKHLDGNVDTVAQLMATADQASLDAEVLRGEVARLRAVITEAMAVYDRDDDVAVDAVMYAILAAASADQPDHGYWSCARCGRDAHAHSLSTSTCAWDPIWTLPKSDALLKSTIAAILDEIDDNESNTDQMREAYGIPRRWS